MLNNANPKSKWANLLSDGFAHLSRMKTLLLWIAFFLIYAVTAGQDILPADSGEFQLITAKWGIAHPPGYPLYTVTGALWTHLLLLGSLPYRTNLLSAALAATTLVLTFRGVVLWSLNAGLNRHSAQIGAFCAVLLLGASGTFWAQATTANIRMPTVLFTVWGFVILAQYRMDLPLPMRNRILQFLALVSGLGIGHHPSLIFVGVGWAAYIVLCDIKLLLAPQRWLKVIGIAVCAWGIPQLYLPIRDAMPNVLLSPGNLSTWHGFWNHVLARGFSGDMLAYATNLDLRLRLPLLPSLFRLQFPVFCMGLMLVGWIWLLKRESKFAIACAISWLIHTFITITYRAPQTIEYLMPAYVPMTLVFGITVAALWSCRFPPHILKKQQTAQPLMIGMLLLLFLRLLIKIPDFALLAAENETRARVEPLLSAAPQNALILADWRWVTPLWTLQQLENRALTADISYVYPEEPTPYNQVWQNRVKQAAERPVFVTHKYEWPDWIFVPIGGGYRLYPRPMMEMPTGLDFTAHEADLGNIRILGYHITKAIQPGQTIELDIAWQANQRLETPPSLTARLWDQQGNLLVASDRFLGSDTALGEIRFTQLTLQLPLDRCSPRTNVTIGVYAVQGNEFIDLGTENLTTLTMLCEYPELPVVHFWPGYFAGQGPFLLGIDYDMLGESAGVAYLHLRGPGASLIIRSDTTQVMVPALDIGESLTMLIPFSDKSTKLSFNRPDGAQVLFLGLPLPSPTREERYTPFGDRMVLISSKFRTFENQTVLTLEWMAALPIASDLIVSARLNNNDASWQLRHDMQPGLGAIPTLKWVTSGSRFLDPHPFTDVPLQPSRFDITVYEPFRMSPLPSPYGEIVSYSLP